MDIENIKVNVKQLLLDPNNLRLDFALTNELVEEKDFKGKQEETLRKLEEANIDELRESILENGFIEVDRIVVKEAKSISSDTKYYVVVEGNRRTAALKGLYNDFINGIISISPDLERQFNAINVCCITASDPKKINTLSASLMGIRHVSGPKPWQGVQSAKLVYNLRLEDRTYHEIGALLGITNRDAQRRYEGYKAYLQMKESYPNKTQPKKHYALLLEFLSNKLAREWLDWRNDKFENKDNREIIYRHLVVNDGDKRAEINNPADARNFNRHLAIEEHKALILSGEKLSELPELPKSNKSKINHISKFNSFIQNLDVDSFDDELKELLNTSIEIISKKLEEGGE
ncbi:ParB/Srx family N-terminal domain-containing protein [Alteromonas stellipolaris]|uniref:ParB/Srx family N-terminal domain-containing protein n=1 Tax=Alteromonas stellipolaris TaxID=233316 RepID=UPI001D5F0122|nr:ParB/Srx family N-terminal domain-containing protein [Alteromonas stellipolaris]MBZ2160769.1 ParB/Srx family N-terminal domain-containing protein [Alteromonas stellipolaris]